MSIAPLVERSYGSTAASPRSTGNIAAVRQAMPASVSTDQTAAIASADQVDKVRLQQAVDAANEFLQPVARNLQFSIDEDSGRTIVKVVDNETNKVVRQIPSEEMMAISRALGRLKGVMVEQEA